MEAPRPPGRGRRRVLAVSRCTPAPRAPSTLLFGVLQERHPAEPFTNGAQPLAIVGINLTTKLCKLLSVDDGGAQADIYARCWRLVSTEEARDARRALSR